MLGGFKMRIEPRVWEKHFNAEGLSKKSEFYEGRENSDQNKPAVAAGFGFIRQDAYDSLENVPWFDRNGEELHEQEKLDCIETGEAKLRLASSSLDK